MCAALWLAECEELASSEDERLPLVGAVDVRERAAGLRARHSNPIPEVYAERPRQDSGVRVGGSDPRGQAGGRA